MSNFGRKRREQRIETMRLPKEAAGIAQVIAIINHKAKFGDPAKMLRTVAAYFGKTIA